MRLCQEIVLGIGGVRALRALGIRPAVWHMNEGHVAFLGPGARAREGEPRRRPGGGAAGGGAQHGLHHPHAGARGQRDLRPRAGEELPRARGPRTSAASRRPPSTWAPRAAATSTSRCSAIRLSSSVNGVSKLHGEVSSAMWRHLWPGDAGRGRSARHQRRAHRELDRARRCARSTRSTSAPTGSDHLLRRRLLGRASRQIPDDDAVGRAPRRRRSGSSASCASACACSARATACRPTSCARVEGLLDPHALTIGFARRFATYKRAVLVLSDLDAAAPRC